MSKKRVDVDQVGEELTSGEEIPEVCCVCGSEENVRKCSGCHATKYCSKRCQKSHHSHHAVYCSAINQLEKVEKDKVYGTKSVREELLDFRQQT